MTDTQTNQDDAKRRADELRQADEQRREDDRKQTEERRAASHQADEKRRAEEFQSLGQRREAAHKFVEAKRKEDDRRAALSPPERLAEDEKRARMTPEEKRADDESKGLVQPDLRDGEQINLLAGQSQFPIFTEVGHTAEFILSEANGQLSRDNAYLADPVTVVVGQPLKFSAAATASLPATYVPAAVGADCDALAIYAGTSNPTNGLRIAIIARNAEVNGKLINWGSIIAAEQALGVTHLATHGIIVR